MPLSLFRDVVPAHCLHPNALLRDCSTMRVGGPADLLIAPTTEEELLQVLEIVRQERLNFCLIGNGSNVLFSDDGFRGVVVQVGKALSQTSWKDHLLYAQAGAALSAIARAAADHSMSGLEFAGGIPGSVGGAVYMNAGAYGGEMGHVISRVKIFRNCQVEYLSREQLAFSYRHSAVMDQGGCVLAAEFVLQPDDKERILATMSELNRRRREKQPLQYHSCGSFFKRPDGHFAGALIEQAGLKGFAIGDAQVSDLHAGFLINRGNATAQQIYELMRHVQEKVFQQSGVHLEPEVKMIGTFEK